jgi:type II secretory pathway component PulC
MRIFKLGLGLLSVSFLGAAALVIAQEQQPSYDSGGKRDPFLALVTEDGRLVKVEVSEENKTTELSVEGVIFDKGGLSLVVVNGAVLKVGDRIGDYQVLKIKEDRVIFIREGETEEILLTKEEE